MNEMKFSKDRKLGFIFIHVSPWSGPFKILSSHDHYPLTPKRMSLRVRYKQFGQRILAAKRDISNDYFMSYVSTGSFHDDFEKGRS